MRPSFKVVFTEKSTHGSHEQCMRLKKDNANTSWEMLSRTEPPLAILYIYIYICVCVCVLILVILFYKIIFYFP